MLSAVSSAIPFGKLNWPLPEPKEPVLQITAPAEFSFISLSMVITIIFPVPSIATALTRVRGGILGIENKNVSAFAILAVPIHMSTRIAKIDLEFFITFDWKTKEDTGYLSIVEFQSELVF